MHATRPTGFLFCLRSLIRLQRVRNWWRGSLVLSKKRTSLIPPLRLFSGPLSTLQCGSQQKFPRLNIGGGLLSSGFGILFCLGCSTWGVYSTNGRFVHGRLDTRRCTRVCFAPAYNFCLRFGLGGTKWGGEKMEKGRTAESGSYLTLPYLTSPYLLDGVGHQNLAKFREQSQLVYVHHVVDSSC